MTKNVQIIGQTAEISLTYVGFDREVTCDTDNRDLILHDGTTPGGVRFLNRDENDVRYQQRSVELDGLLGFEPSNRGFLVRLGPQNYRLRRLTVDGDQLTLTDSDGYDGNPLIGIAHEIKTDHLFSGVVTFAQPIVATGGVEGDVVGNLSGDVVGDVTGNLTGDVTGNVTGDTTGSHVGNVDVRGKTLLLDAGQITLAMLDSDIINTIIQAGLPVGSVVAFAGDTADIPPNWHICDGTSGTPDLRARFIIGVNATYTEYSVGGTVTHSHEIDIASSGAHGHSGLAAAHALSIAELPAHAHHVVSSVHGTYDGIDAFPEDAVVCDATGGSSGASYSLGHTGTAANVGKSSVVGGDATHDHVLAVDMGGAHTHTAESASVSNLPPYYALYYIMKGA